MLKLVVFSEKYPDFGHRRCPDMTVPVSLLNFEAITFVSIFLSYLKIVFVREMTLLLVHFNQNLFLTAKATAATSSSSKKPRKRETNNK